MAAGCDQGWVAGAVLQSERGQFELRDSATVARAGRMLAEAGPLLRDQTFCPRIDCAATTPGCVLDPRTGARLETIDVEACVTWSVEGAATASGANCLVATGVGEAVVRLTPRACPANAFGFQPTPDTLTLPVVESFSASLVAPADAFALAELDPGPIAAFATDATLEPHADAWVVPGAPVDFAIVVSDPSSGQPVGWNPRAWALSVRNAVHGEVPYVWGAGLLTVNLVAGSEATVRMGDGIDRDVEVGRIRAIDEDAIESLEVVVGYARASTPGGLHGAPVAARAILRTAGGEPVYGAPVRWDVVEGALPLWRDANWRGFGPDYVALRSADGEGCARPPETPREVRATIVASYRRLRAVAEVSWTETPAELEREVPYSEPSECAGPGPDRGPGCTIAEPPSPPAVFVALVGWAVVWRRRRGPT